MLYSVQVVLWLVGTAWAGPLDDYVARKDKSYQWRVIDERMITPQVVFKEMILTSQTWRGMDWHHRVHLYYPAAMKGTREVFLFIAGGGWNDEEERQREAKLAKERQDRKPGEIPAADLGRKPGFEQILSTEMVNITGMPAVVLYNVPKQPIFEGKVEDQIISYTFDEYLTTGDATWPLLVPMVKSAVRTMDAITEFGAKEWQSKVTDFVVAGASKRGWTTWLTSAADKRVKACAPAVIDVLNMTAQMKHQVESYGAYSEEIDDYTSRNLPAKWETPRGKDLMKIVDPYFYLDRITQPKMLVLGTNDPYWTLDALNIYWGDIKGDKYVLYVSNKGHAPIDMPRLMATFSSLALRVAGKVTYPKMTWDLRPTTAGLTLTIEADRPIEHAWAYVTTSSTRDFRKSTWHHEVMRAADGRYVYELPMPEQGYGAMYGEALFKLEGGQPLYLCTNVRIIGPGPKTVSAPAAGAK